QAGLLLKGRLFLGYQEKSSVLEVISYNPEAGRFEFQEVQNYAPGLEPRVTYARRTLCLSCHQNAGPIFPMEPWRETDANRQVSARLPPVSRASSLKPAYAPRFDDAWAVDYASDRANYLSSSQFLWREGCGSDDATPSVNAIRCRAAMLAAVLQYRLIGLIDQRSHLYRESFLPVVTRNWHGRWPGGLYIATADIPDRDPFSPTATLIENPLTARPPRAVWSTPTPHLLAGIVYQTADFLTQTDIARIDDHLYRRAIENGVPTSSYRASCAFDRGAGVDSRQIIRFSCTQTDDRKTPGFSATGLVVIDKGRVVDGNIDRLTLPAQPELRFLKLGRAQIDEADGQRTISVRLMEKEGRIGARLLDGTLLELIRFRWPDGPGQTGSEIIRDAQLTTIRNLAPLDDAIEQMIAASATGKIDALSSKPLRRHSILKALHSNLGMAPLRWRHDGASPQPASGSQNNAPARSPLFAPFYRHCSACHGEAQRFPPGFLNGTAAEVLRKLSRCAPQIVLRLDTWNHRSDDRSVSPMPPAHWLSSSGLSEADWRESDSLKALQSAARQLLASAGPAQPAHLSETAQLCTP
ncbi:MAG: hypothetical protein ACR2RB_03090, partial [Gammaproteobacteria bacterium]